jgi:signal transduction histidine kinase
MKIVQRHEGRITVKSIPQKGARFYITLPEKHTEVPTAHDKP